MTNDKEPTGTSDTDTLENSWYEPDGPVTEPDAVGGMKKKRALMIGSAIVAVLLVAAGTVVAIVAGDTDTDSSVEAPLVALPALDVSENAADEIPTRKLAGIDVSECTPAQITVGEDGWVGFDTSCVKLVASEDMPDQP